MEKMYCPLLPSEGLSCLRYVVRDFLVAPSPPVALPETGMLAACAWHACGLTTSGRLCLDPRTSKELGHDMTTLMTI